MNIVSFIRDLQDRKKKKQQARQQAHDEEVVRELFQICEHNGEIWFTYDGQPVIPESMLTESAIEVVKKLRKQYIEENGAARHYHKG